MDQVWYHGSPLRLGELKVGSTITTDRQLARIFSHKPSIVSVDDDGTIKHNGTQPGYLYRIATSLDRGDVYPHPNSSMAPGKEWLTRRPLDLELIGTTAVREMERLTGAETAALRARAQGEES
jgi:hypothetical protein